MDEIDSNPDLSREGKQLKRNEVAVKALAGFELSKTLAQAREVVRYDASSAVRKALEQAEAGWQRAVDRSVSVPVWLKLSIRGDDRWIWNK
jgi:hypothetical protein